VSDDTPTQMMPPVPSAPAEQDGEDPKDPRELFRPHTSGVHAAPAVPMPSVPFLDPSAQPGFHEWAEKWLTENIPMVEAKAREYGSNSLQRKGERYLRALGLVKHTPDNPAAALELACFQYIAEKLDRVEDAALRGLPASDDTWTDLAVYALMALYIRKHGRWL